MPKYYHPDTDYIRKLGAAPPVAIPHMTEEEIAQNMKPLKPNTWRMEGPGILVGETEMGKLVQNIGTDHICVGTDKNGMPILRKIVC